jgi:hypothetical protein
MQSLLLQILQDLGRMSFRIRDRNPVFFDRSVGPDQSGGTNRPFHRFALGILPRAPGSICLHGFDLWIGEKHERQVKFSDKLIMGVYAVSAHTDDYGIRLRHRLNSVAEPARFFGSARRIVFRIKPEHDVFPGIVAERMLLAVAPRQSKSRGLLSFKIRHGLPPYKLNDLFLS